MKINAKNSPLFDIGKAKWEVFAAGYTGPYNLAPAVYIGMNRKINFVCKKHGMMQMDAKNMMNGKSCQACAFEARKGKLRFTTKKAVGRFLETHGDKYDYSRVKYEGQQVPVTVVCKTHGAFLQKPEFHWSGSGCPQCFHAERRGAAQRMSHQELVDRVDSVFGGLFDLSEVAYENSQADIYVRCIKHNKTYPTRANWLLNGNNPCTKCNHMKSAGEMQVLSFTSFLTEAQSRVKIIPGSTKELDIYLPHHNLAIEYCGEYHHGVKDKDDEKQNRHRHIQKHKGCAGIGVRLITMYEMEWKNRTPQVKRLLRSAVGKLKGRLFARKCELRKVCTKEAREFFDKYHIQGGAGSGEHYGLYWKDKLVACMRFTFGNNDRGAAAATRTWTLSRYATRVTVVGGASRAFSAFVNEHQPEEVKSFSDNRYFSGGMYAKLGFSLDEEMPEDYQVWSPKLGVLPKPQYQRRNIPKRLEDHGVEDTFDPETDPRTEAEMTYLMGARRIYDCGKKRWVWKSA